MNRVLVAGGAGFLGSNLCKYLLEKDNKVICVDNFITGSENNLTQFINNPNFEFIKHDVTEPLFINVDQIYNLACPASPIHYQRDPISTIKTSVLGALNLLELAKNNKASILQASTSEVYGDPDVSPQNEDYRGRVNTVGPRACYDEGKRVVETLFFEYYKQYNVKTKIIRIFNTYGPNMNLNDGRVVSNFIIQALMGNDITIYGDGSQTRSFCYVNDLIDGMVKMMNVRSDFIGPVNIGNPQEITILELAEKVIEMTKTDSKLVFKELPRDDPKQRKPDIFLAKNKLKWEPKIKLNEGLKYTIDYFEKCLL